MILVLNSLPDCHRYTIPDYSLPDCNRNKIPDYSLPDCNRHVLKIILLTDERT